MLFSWNKVIITKGETLFYMCMLGNKPRGIDCINDKFILQNQSDPEIVVGMIYSF